MSRPLQSSTIGRTLKSSVLPRVTARQPVSVPITDDLSRNVFGILGLSIDAIDFATLLRRVESAAADPSPLLISTPNVNFLITSQRSAAFRESILRSDLCLADGMPLIWIAKLLNIPIIERIAGSDLFGRLKSNGRKTTPLRVFLLGGADGLADIVCKKLNSERCGLECVGALNPGFGSIAEISTRPIIDAINTAKPDLLAVFFGAEKAQAWLMQNHQDLHAPIRAQFGATINFEAGTVNRAPRFMRSTGFEWLWRILEEPYLWRRYWNDGLVLLKLMVTSVVPLLIESRSRRSDPVGLSVEVEHGEHYCTINLSGDALEAHVNRAIPYFRSASSDGKEVTIDISGVSNIDFRFFGLLLMLRKQLASGGKALRFVGTSPQIRRMFRLNRFEFLLSSD